MKKLLLSLTAAITALVLPGCLQNETTIHLKKDGSGTLVEETRLGAQMLGMIEQMSAHGGEATKDPMADMFSEDKAKARASELGEGVVFTKFETVSKDGSKGARITYTFKDINKLNVSPGDGMKDMSPMGAAPADPTEKSDPIAFSYADGKLTVKMPKTKTEDDDSAADADAKAPDMDNPQMEAMMKKMMGDMKISLKLEIEPGISKTDATHTNGNTITLMEMEMGKILENPDSFKKLNNLDQKNPAASMELLKDIDGVKFEVKKEITVELK